MKRQTIVEAVVVEYLMEARFPHYYRVFEKSLKGHVAMTTLAFTTPDKGDDPDLDKMVDEAIKAIKGGGATPDEGKIRDTMWKRLSEARGTKGEAEPKTKEKVAAAPKVDINAGEKTLTTERLTRAAKTVAHWYEKPEDDAFVGHFFEMRTTASTIGNLLVVGPSGSGKTEGLRRKTEAMGKKFYKFDVATVTTEDKWVGHKEVDATGTHFILSELLRWLEGVEHEPGVVCFDEVNRVHPSRLNILIPILDGSQAIFVPDAGRYVNVHPQTIVVATANIGSAFGGTFVMDRALRERFNYTLERTFPPIAEEVKVITSATGCDADKGKLLVEIADQTRKKWVAGDLESPISTRTLKAAGYLIASGMSVMDAMQYTVLPLYRAEGGAQSERGMVKAILTGKGATSA